MCVYRMRVLLLYICIQKWLTLLLVLVICSYNHLHTTIIIAPHLLLLLNHYYHITAHTIITLYLPLLPLL